MVEDPKKVISDCLDVLKVEGNPIRLCRGHDVSCVLAIIFNNLKKTNRSSRNKNDMNDAILGHIPSDAFSKLEVYRDLINWLSPS